MKTVQFRGSSLDDLRSFPASVMREAGTFRVIYVAKFENAVYVLHCFQKKSQKTSKKDIDLAAKRYKDLIKEIAS